MKNKKYYTVGTKWKKNITLSKQSEKQKNSTLAEQNEKQKILHCRNKMKNKCYIVGTKRTTKTKNTIL